MPTDQLANRVVGKHLDGKHRLRILDVGRRQPASDQTGLGNVQIANLVGRQGLQRRLPTA